MKARFVFLLFSLFWSIISQDSQNTLISYPNLDFNQIIHSNSELGKVCETQDGHNVIISKRDDNTILMSKIDKRGKFVYHQTPVTSGYSKNAKIIESKTYNGEDGYTLYYKYNGREYLSQFKDEGIDSRRGSGSDSYNLIVSALNLKNGKIFYAGIKEPSSDFVQTTIELKVFDPISQSEVSALSFNTLDAHSKFISCAELKDNEVYCAYVHKENILRSPLKMQQFKISSSGMITQGTPYLIKYFYTQFNSLKLTKISTNRVGIIFQVGDPKYQEQIPFGNTGKDLYYVDLQVTQDSFEVLRYDYIYNECRYKTDAEDYTIDLVAISQNTIYAICEKDNNGKDAVAFQLIKVGAEEKLFEPIPLNFNAKAVKNPSLVKVDNSIGILYTRIDSNDNKDVMFLMINYPDCEDSESTIYDICPNDVKINSLSANINMVLRNPYPSSMISTPLYYRIVSSNNIKIYNGDSQIELNKDYLSSTKDSLFIKEFTANEGAYIEYTVTRKDGEETILGKTCRIKINFPQCLDQCVGCDEKGTEENNHCFSCKEGYYAVETTNDATGCGNNGKLYNCNRCDIACTKCYGPFDPSKPTTDCYETKCNYDGGYYPFEKDTRICINEKNKTYWDENLKCVLFLDKTNSDSKEWRWKCCHERCGSCHLSPVPGNNNCDTCLKDKFYFFINQTEENGLIPGNCHESCEGDGCYKCTDRMCPCLPHCKVCHGPTICEECRETWLLPPEQTSCNKTCDYCLTPHFEIPENKSKGRCVNCKEYFNPPRYTFNNKCLKEEEIPVFKYTDYRSELDFYEVTKKYHVFEEKCNMLTGCKEGCRQCAQLETDNCTECEQDYYMEDPFKKNRTGFRCFTKRQCRGNDPYPHQLDLRAGGVTIVEDGRKVCLNCRQRNDSFRQPEDNYWCGENISMTYVDIPEYNKLSKCYVRCKTCDKAGHSCAMACTSCRDSKYYDLIRYDKTHGQCYRKQHKCGIYPYYHNYELAIDEDDCGEDCDVCLYNFQCPKEFPFFKFETHECVEFCPATQVLGGQCNINVTIGAIILLRNPFGFRCPYDFLNREIYLKEFLSSGLAEYFLKTYQGSDIDFLRQQIINNVGTGKVYNLPNSHIVAFNNISIELSSVKLELEKILNFAKGIIPKTEDGQPTSSGVDLSECQAILKKKYNLPEEEDLLVIKADTLEELNLTEYLGIETNYQLFSYSLGAFLPLSACKDENASVTVTNPFKQNLLNDPLYPFQSKITSVLSNGYDAFDAYSPFYNDICTPFTNENGNDVLLDARRKDYYNENINICESGCIFIGYNTKSMSYICKCNIKTTPGESAGEYTGEIVERSLPENFKDLISKRSNIEVFKCASNVFSAEGQKKNFGSYILIAGFAAFIGVVVFHCVKEKGSTEIYTNLNVANPPKGKKENEDKKEKKGKTGKEEKKEKKKGKKKKDKVQNPEKEIYGVPLNANPDRNRPQDVVVDLKYEDYEILFAPYSDALNSDTLSFVLTYWNFLKFKQNIIFTFVTNNKGILRSTKIALFILFIAFYMAFTALFFNDEIMRALYIYKGNTDAAVHVPNIILSSLCSFIACLIVRYVCLNERDISKITSERNRENRSALVEKLRRKDKIKLYVLYGITAVLIILCWYYVSAFCAIFKNSQKNYLINFLICYIVCNLWPCVTSIIPTIMRRKALSDRSKCLYNASQIVSIF